MSYTQFSKYCPGGTAVWQGLKIPEDTEVQCLMLDTCLAVNSKLFTITSNITYPPTNPHTRDANTCRTIHYLIQLHVIPQVHAHICACMRLCVYVTIGISDNATAGGLLGFLLYLFITVLLSSTVGTAKY